MGHSIVDEIFLRGLKTLNFRRGYHLEISEGVVDGKISYGGQYFKKNPKAVYKIFVNFGSFRRTSKQAVI